MIELFFIISILLQKCLFFLQKRYRILISLKSKLTRTNNKIKLYHDKNMSVPSNKHTFCRNRYEHCHNIGNINF